MVRSELLISSHLAVFAADASYMHSSCLIVIVRRRPSIFLQPAFSFLGDQVCVSHLFYNIASEKGFDLDALERQTFF